MFDSGSVQSQVLFPETISSNGIFNGVHIPRNWDRLSKSAQDMYMHCYVNAQIIGCTERKCHQLAMDEIRRTHVLRGGQWVLPTKSQW